MSTREFLRNWIAEMAGGWLSDDDVSEALATVTLIKGRPSRPSSPEWWEFLAALPGMVDLCREDVAEQLRNSSWPEFTEEEGIGTGCLLVYRRLLNELEERDLPVIRSELVAFVRRRADDSPSPSDDEIKALADAWEREFLGFDAFYDG